MKKGRVFPTHYFQHFSESAFEDLDSRLLESELVLDDLVRDSLGHPEEVDAQQDEGLQFFDPADFQHGPLLPLDREGNFEFGRVSKAVFEQSHDDVDVVLEHHVQVVELSDLLESHLVCSS